MVGISFGRALAGHFAVEHRDRARQILLVNSGALGRAFPTPGALLALGWYSIRRSVASLITRFRIAEDASARFGWPLHPIDDCGHFAIGERPDAFVDALRAAMGA